ncbi:MAG: NAD(P)/FAD-dependent oxidoreductase [Bacteroidota bacterium]
MTKRAFLKQLGIFAAASPFMGTLLASCDEKEGFYPQFNLDFDGKVLIIGAGAAGLTAGHILRQQGIDFDILEASAIHGGRVKKATNLADFPIDLGAEWIHTDPSILAKLNNDRNSMANIDIITYNPQTIAVWRNDKLRQRNFARHFYSEYKFKHSTWYDFFDELMVPHFRDKIVYNSPVTGIDYTGSRVVVTTQNGGTYEGDRVLITVPITILQSEFITFSPALPSWKREAIQEERMPGGVKVFIEFSERFYPDMVMLDNLFAAAADGDHTYYDAAFGKDAERHVFALFTVGDKAEPYTSLETDEAIFTRVMSELDEMFDGKASQHYLQHEVQNWTREPFIRGSYSHGWGTPETLAQPVADRLYFAGEATAPNGNTSTVHGAAESAYEALRLMLEG